MPKKNVKFIWIVYFYSQRRVKKKCIHEWHSCRKFMIMPGAHCLKGRLEEWRLYRPSLTAITNEKPNLRKSPTPPQSQLKFEFAVDSLSTPSPGVLVDTTPKQLSSLVANKATGQKTPWVPLQVQPAAKPNLGRTKARAQQEGQQTGPQQECKVEVYTWTKTVQDTHIPHRHTP